MSVEKVLVSVIAALFQSIVALIILFNQISERTTKEKAKFLLLMYVYCIVAFLFIPNQLRFISFVIATSIIIYLTLNINDRKLVLYSFNIEIISSISELIVTLILVLFGVKSTEIVNNNFYNLLANVLISILSIIIVNIGFIKKLICKFINIFDRNRKLLNYLYIFIVMLYLIVLKNGFELILKSNYYINILFMFSIIIVIVIVLRNESKYEQLKEENKQMLNYVTKYEKIITAQGKTNHEFKNQLMVIRGYAQMHSDKILEYIDEIVKDSNKAGSSYLISQLNNFPDGGIKGLLYYKLSIMEDENIKYSINVEKGVKTKLKTLSINNYKNITKILGVLLDNAIDASKKSKHKKINISVIKDNKNIIFKIYNTYKGKIDIEKVGTGYTSKGKGHGYGLRLVKDIINENKVFDISHDLEDNYFVSSLYIKNKNQDFLIFSCFKIIFLS